MAAKKATLTGLDLVEKLWPKDLNGARVGLVAHPASVNRKLEHARRHLPPFEEIPARRALRSAARHPRTDPGQHGRVGGLPRYGHGPAGLQPVRQGAKTTPDMLKNIDVLAVDLQDVGARYYTFIWTLDLCMQTCREAGKTVVVLDRPNPIGGRITEGPVLRPGYHSFVGLRPLPVRHGMTIAEIGHYLEDTFHPGIHYRVIPMQGWKRRSWFDQTRLPWVMPSPNMPTPDTALVYPGMCLLEGTNLSEGRGTTRPFEIFGAPFIHPPTLVGHLREFKLPGVTFRPLFFEPTFQKHAGVLCGGAQIHVTDREKFKPFRTGVAILKAVHNTWPRDFAWKQPPYEYEEVKMPIDILAGSGQFRKDIESWKDIKDMEAWWKEELKGFEKVRKKYLLYK